MFPVFCLPAVFGFTASLGKQEMNFCMVNWVLVSKRQQLFTHKKKESMSEVAVAERRARARPFFVPNALKSDNIEQNDKILTGCWKNVRPETMLHVS